MSTFDQLMEAASLARRNRDYPKAEQILSEALDAASEPGRKEAALRQLFYLYFSPVYEHLSKAEECLKEMDKLNPSAHNGMEWAMFELNCKRGIKGARVWAGIAVQRAESEKADGTHYSALALVGLLAAREFDLSTVRSVLQKLRSLVSSDKDLPFGDEVVFLEASTEFDADIKKSVAELAAELLPFIENSEYKRRVENLV
jgi:hypothetical protein